MIIWWRFQCIYGSGGALQRWARSLWSRQRRSPEDPGRPAIWPKIQVPGEFPLHQRELLVLHKAPDMPSASAKDQKTQSPPRGPRVTRRAPGGPEGALCTTRTQRAPGITGKETYMPPKVQRIREVELVRVNYMYTLRVTRYFDNAQWVPIPSLKFQSFQ